MCDPFPDSVDPRRLAEIGRELTGTLPLVRLPRLAQVICEPATGEESVAYRLSFRRDAGGRALVQGEVTATLRLPCERCNGIVSLPVASEFTLAVVVGLDQAAQLPEDYEPLLPEDGAVDPAGLVEDELLLALPAVARHPAGTCRPPHYEQPDESADTSVRAKDNPFAVLESLKRRH
jgi:uncharacterized protein